MLSILQPLAGKRLLLPLFPALFCVLLMVACGDAGSTSAPAATIPSTPIPTSAPTPTMEPRPTYTPTPEPIPTATSSPTPAPTNTSTPTQIPTEAPADKPTPEVAATPVSAGQLEIDASTTGRDLVDSLTEEAQSCIRSTLGDAAYQDFLDQPLVAQIDRPGPSPLECLPVEMVAEFTVAALSVMLGGLADDSATCLRDLYATSGLNYVPTGESEDPEATELALRFLMCLSDEEAGQLMSGDGMDLFTPSQLRCVDDEIGIDGLVDAMMGDPSQGLNEIATVLESCGVTFFPVSPPGDEGAFNQVSLLWLQYDPELQGLIDCLQEAASMEELDAFFSGKSGSSPDAIYECLGQYAELLPSGG